jgi:hypothetical protein
MELSKTKWFTDFFTNSMIRIQSGASELTFDDMVDFLVEKCSDEAPKDNARFFCKREGGPQVFFEPKKALDSLARNWKASTGPSLATKKRFLQLYWAQAWLQSNSLSYKSDSQHTKARLVDKDAKILMMRIFYPCHAPTWKDQHVVRVGVGEDMVWAFRPLQWMDDISNLWLGGHRRSVKLSDEDMKVLETLPWFTPWLEKLRKKRMRRDEKKPPEYVPDDATQSCDYTKSVNAVCDAEEEEDATYDSSSQIQAFDAEAAESQEL